MRAIPVPMRERILQLYGRGKSTAAIAEALGYCAAAVRRVRQRFRERGTVEPLPRSGRPTLLTLARQRRLREQLAAHPDATLSELSAALDRPFRASVLDRWLRKLGFRYKKNSIRQGTKSSGRSRATRELAPPTSPRAPRTSGVRGRKRGQHQDDPAARPRRGRPTSG